MALIGFFILLALFIYYRRQLQHHRLRDGADAAAHGSGLVRWHDEWHRQWAEKFHRQAQHRLREFERNAERRRRRLARQARRLGLPIGEEEPDPPPDPPLLEPMPGPDAELLRRIEKRAAAEVGYYVHLMVYLGVLSILALINVFTTEYPWFVWPALGWGFALFIHYVAVVGSRLVRKRYFYPAVDREVRREKAAMQTEKQATIVELSASIAHEIRNPIAAAKSLVQQIGEDPAAADNPEYARVAVAELDRVERQISHLLKYAKEEDYHFDHVNLATVVDSALAQMRAKLEAARIDVVRNYVGGPTVFADADKLRQVLANILDNSIDAFESASGPRRIDIFVENGGRGATLRVRDNGCGIAAERIERIFNPFFTTKEKGTGLGMAISKKIVEAHDGTIDVVSQAGHGTEFVIGLPA